MLHRLFEPNKSLSKSDKKTFIPFQNERDFRGALITQTTPKVAEGILSRKDRNLAMIENLKKSSKEYFFDKKYSKMVNKLQRRERNLESREHDYQREVDKCLRIVEKDQNRLRDKPKHEYYVDLKNELNSKLASFKSEIIDKLHQKKQKTKSHKKVDSSDLTKSASCFLTPSLVSKENSPQNKQVNRQLFATMGKRSQLMADFSNQGLKYKHMVEGRRLDPWDKWYQKQEVEIFPGEKIVAKQLQKSIY